MTTASAPCVLCATEGGRVVWRDDLLRVVAIDEPGIAAFYRVISHPHVAEWTDLPAEQRAHFMAVLVAVEAALRQVLQPTKINLASLGNAVAHLHWHVVARFDWDSHYPQSVWGAQQRVLDAADAQLVAAKALAPEVERLIHASLLLPQP